MEGSAAAPGSGGFTYGGTPQRIGKYAPGIISKVRAKPKPKEKKK